MRNRCRGMDWSEVLRRIEGGQDTRTEFTRGLGDFSALGRTLCAFANGDGGLVVVGVDGPGTIVGVKEDPETVQERLTSFLNTGCGKLIIAECNRHHTDHGWVHWIEVRRRQRKYDPFSYDGRFWIRRARRTVAASSSELQELFNTFGFVLSERQIIPSGSVNDIDVEAFRSFMRAQGMRTASEPQPDIENDLQNAWVCDWLDRVLRPTLYGLMVFGRNPQGHPHTTNLFIQCVAYAGSDQVSDVLSEGEGKGRLDEQVNRSMGWFRSLGRREAYRGLNRRNTPLCPEEILREALVNAVIHRDYGLAGSQVLLEVFSDRIVVSSPGTLPTHVTVAQARCGGAPRSRNEVIANAMVVRQLMDRRGRGWLMMRQRMLEFNGTEPELVSDEKGRFTRVTLRVGQPMAEKSQEAVRVLNKSRILENPLPPTTFGFRRSGTKLHALDYSGSIVHRGAVGLFAEGIHARGSLPGDGRRTRGVRAPLPAAGTGALTCLTAGKSCWTRFAWARPRFWNSRTCVFPAEGSGDRAVTSWLTYWRLSPTATAAFAFLELETGRAKLWVFPLTVSIQWRASLAKYART